MLSGGQPESLSRVVSFLGSRAAAVHCVSFTILVKVERKVLSVTFQAEFEKNGMGRSNLVPLGQLDRPYR